MKQRTITGFFIVLVTAIAVALKFLPYEIGDYLFDIFIVCISLIAATEMCNMIDQKSSNKFLIIMYPIFNYVVLLLNIHIIENPAFLFLVQFIGLIIYFVITFLSEFFLNKDKSVSPVKTSLNSILACIYPSFLFGFFLIINHLDLFAGASQYSFVFVLMIIVITMMSDTCAYLVGRTFKGPKLAPKISPNKTISGGIGGLLGGVLGAMIIFSIVYNTNSLSIILSMYNLKWWNFALIGMVGSAISQCGDLFESALKRKANVKDSGNIFPGHGGMMDRIDAMTFCCVFIGLIAIGIVC